MKPRITLLVATALAVATAQAQDAPKPRAETDAPKREAPVSEERRDDARPQERRDSPKPQPRSERSEESKKRSDTPAHSERSVSKPKPPGRPEGKPTPFLGIAMEPVPPQLRSHFDIPEGFGVMVGMVMEDSPAAKAGIRQHDLVLKVDDQRIVNMEQLKALISSGKKGAVVKLTVISKGQEKTIDVTLDERVMPAASEEPIRREFHGGPMPGNPGWHGPHGEGAPMREWQEKMEQFQQGMRQFQEAMEKWRQGDRRSPQPQPPMMQPPGDRRPERGQTHRGGDRPPEPGRDRHEPGDVRRPPMESPRGGDRDRAESRDAEGTSTTVTSATISRRDDSGEYVLSRHGRGDVFSVRPTRGESQSWDLSNEEARQSIPPQFREKLEMLESIRVDGR